MRRFGFGLAFGGTGASTAAGALTNLGISVTTGSMSVLQVGARIEQSGTATTGASGATTITFPVAFPNGVTSINCTAVSGSVNTPDTVQVSSVSTTQFQANIAFSSNGSTGAGSNVQFYWDAVGW